MTNSSENRKTHSTKPDALESQAAARMRLAELLGRLLASHWLRHRGTRPPWIDSNRPSPVVDR
jgi:hypothetical protein